MIIDENIVYYFCKKILKKSGIYVFAGEPPGGSDELHRVELKNPFNPSKGSKGSRKFDLIAYHKSTFLLIELKDSYKKHDEDIEKLRDTLDDDLWLKSLWESINERKLFGNGVIPKYSLNNFLKQKEDLFQLCLGSGPSSYIPPENFVYFEINENYMKCSYKKN